MIEGIKEIGDIIISETPEKFLESLTLNVPPEKQDRKQYIIIIEFDTARDTISFDYEEIKEETPKKYLWLGNAKSNNPQGGDTEAQKGKYPSPWPHQAHSLDDARTEVSLNRRGTQ